MTMGLRSGRCISIIFLVTVLLTVSVALLPISPRRHFHSLDDSYFANLGSLYDRLHHDSRPVDVAILGASHIVLGVDTPTLIAHVNTSYQRSEIVNLAIPEPGRNLDWAIARQLFEQKKPKLLIIGVSEHPIRFGHRAFKYVASQDELVDPLFIANASFVPDLMYLPYRQMHTGLEALTEPIPSYSALPQEVAADTLARHERSQHPQWTREKIRYYARWKYRVHPPFLPRQFADIEYGMERASIRRIVALAQAHHCKVMFLFIPVYGSSKIIQEREFYTQYGPIIEFSDLADDIRLYWDSRHLAPEGARIVADRLAPVIAAALKSPS